MSRIELLQAASMKLAAAVLLLLKAGEQHLATSAGQLAEIVEFRASPLGSAS
jgi:hypothetical protein